MTALFEQYPELPSIPQRRSFWGALREQDQAGLASIELSGHQQQWKRGDVLVSFNRRPEEQSPIIIVRSGVAVARTVHGAATLRLYDSGDLVGYDEGLCSIGAALPQTVAAASMVWGLVLPRERFATVLGRSAIGQLLQEVLADRLLEADILQYLRFRGISSSRFSVAVGLVLLATRHGRARSRGAVELPLTHADLASMFAISLKTIGRILKVLGEADLITSEHGKLTVLDADGLCRFALEKGAEEHLNRVSATSEAGRTSQR